MKKGLCLVSLLLFFVSLSLFYTRAAGDLSAKDARKMIAKMAGIDLPTDNVRVRSVSVTGSTAIVDAQIETAFRFVKKDDKWQITEIRTGDNRWEDVEMIARSINHEKTERAKAELESMATALEAFKRERGSYIISKEQSVLIDNLNPRYLSRIIRYDPWHKPYFYDGTGNSYTIRSAGPDGKENTADDVVKVSN
jgi:hypothetical protein